MLDLIRLSEGRWLARAAVSFGGTIVTLTETFEIDRMPRVEAVIDLDADPPAFVLRDREAPTVVFASCQLPLTTTPAAPQPAAPEPAAPEPAAPEPLAPAQTLAEALALADDALALQDEDAPVEVRGATDAPSLARRDRQRLWDRDSTSA